MKRPSGKAKKRRNAVQVWTDAQARALVPYLKSVVASLREHKLTAQRHHLTTQRLLAQPGRPDRSVLIAQDEARREAERAEEAFDSALAELEAIDVYCLDPLAGQALVPTVYEDQLAWYVYDHFEKEPLQFWRYHTDPLEMRRPVAEMQRAPAAESWTA
jgi:hypothetical protein